MRLIDADEFKGQIAGMAIVNNYSADKANKMCDLIDNQKTAYDENNVLEQLHNAGAVTAPRNTQGAGMTL